jgi:hypothetical protein
VVLAGFGVGLEAEASGDHISSDVTQPPVVGVGVAA